MNNFWQAADQEWAAMREPDTTLNLGMRFGQAPRYVSPRKPALVTEDVLASFTLLGTVEEVAEALDTSVLKVKAILKAAGIRYKFRVAKPAKGPLTFRCPDCERIGESPTCPHCQAVIAPALILSAEIDRGIATRSLAGTTRRNRGNTRQAV